MWPFSTKRSPRRMEIRRTRAERAAIWQRRLPFDRALAALLLVAFTGTIATLVLNIGGEGFNLRVGEVTHRAITARVNFEVEDEPRTIEMRVQARDSSPNYYRLDTALIDDVVGRFANAYTLARAHMESPEKFVEAAAKNRVMLDEAGAAELRRLAEDEAADEYNRFVEAAASTLRVRPLVEPEGMGVRRTAQNAVLRDPDNPQERTVAMTQLQFATRADAPSFQRMVDEVSRVFPEALRLSAAASLVAMLTTDAGDVRPLYRYDAERTLRIARDAESAVEMQYLRYSAGDMLTDIGPISEDELRLLRAEHTAFTAGLEADGRMFWRPESLGRAALVWVVVMAVFLCAVCAQREVATNMLRRAITAATLLAVLATTRWMFLALEAPPQLAVGAVAFCAGLLGIIYHSNVVIAVCAGLITLTTLAVQQGVEFLVILSLVSAILVFGLRDVRNRGKIVVVGALAAGAVFVSTAMAGLAQGQQLSFVMVQCLWAAGSTLLAAFIIEGILPGIERVFRLSTGMTLLEWCDANKPLMRMMAAEAPGTYNHSLLVGALAEAAAEAIGANGLLARAGAYYHDIGKIHKPEYFVENQLTGHSRHERLSPAMSLLIIVGHVKDGIEMAREYSLPAALHPFIAEHHGTTLVEYFYHAANKLRKPDDPEVKDTEFRYPGPRPQSRETAIVMLCDGVEGAVRAMQEPTPGRIEDVVSEVVRKRLMDGQFDQCDITFRELAEIEKSLVRSLCGIYHGRIQYPSSTSQAPGDVPVVRSVG